MGKDAQEEEAGRYSGLISGILNGTNKDPNLQLGNYQLRGYTPQRIEGMLNKGIDAAGVNLSGDRNRAISQGAGLATNQGRALNLSNPYALGRVATNDIYGKYAGGFGDLAKQRADNPYKAIMAQLGINEANFGPIAKLLGLQGGNVGNRAGSPGAAIGGGLLAAGGSIGAAAAGNPGAAITNNFG